MNSWFFSICVFFFCECEKKAICQDNKNEIAMRRLMSTREKCLFFGGGWGFYLSFGIVSNCRRSLMVGGSVARHELSTRCSIINSCEWWLVTI